MVFSLGATSVGIIGNTRVYGALVSGGALSLSGNAKVIYDATSLNNAAQTVATYGKVFGSWQDMGIN